MTSVFDLYGYGVPPYGGDSIDASTADVAALYDQKQRYGNSLFGRIDNWLRQKQSQPNQLASDASLWDQAAEAGNRLAHLPVDMLIAGSRTANNWAGSPQFPERVEPGDMLAPLGIGAMAGLGGALKGAARQGRMMPDTIPASYFDDIMPAAGAGRAATDLTVPQNRLARAANDGDDGPLRGNYPAPGNLPLRPSEASSVSLTEAYERYSEKAFQRGLQPDSFERFREAVLDAGIVPQRQAGRSVLPGVELFADQSRASFSRESGTDARGGSVTAPSVAVELPETAALKFDGQVFTGRDHSEAISKAWAAAKDDAIPEQGGDLEGYMTTKGRFVTRQEASDLLRQAGLPSYGINGLHSLALRDLQASDKWPTKVGPNGDRTGGQAGRADRLKPLFADQSRASMPGLVSGALDLDNAGGSLTAGRAATPQEMPDALNYPANSLSPSQPRAGQMADGQQGRMPDAAGQPAPAGRSAIADDPLLGPSINSMLDLRRMIDDEGQYFVRWSRGPEYDLAAGATSKDYQTGKLHSGLSAEEISKELSDHDLFNLLRDYSFLRSPSNPAKPHIYSGNVVGQDSDGASSIRPKKHVGSLSDEFISRLDDESISDRLKLMDKVSLGRRILSGDNRNGPQSYYDRVANELEANEKLLNDAGGPVVLANQSRASLPGLLAGTVDEPRGITAYHGSPHDFDRFDMSKIGTGEGAQAYGHGLYFAESEGVAQSYRQALQQVDLAPFDVAGVPPKHWNAARMFAQNTDPKLPEVAARDFAQWTGSDVTPELIEAFRKAKKPGRMYEVRINADPDLFLDYDLPLSKQSQSVQAKLKSALGDGVDKIEIRDVANGWQVFVNGEPASVPYGRKQDAEARVKAGVRKGQSEAIATDRVFDVARDPDLTSRLRDAGIPGIRYLDQGSRTAGEGSRNYVLFRDDIIEIVKKYGIAAAASMYGMSAVDEAMASEGP